MTGKQEGPYKGEETKAEEDKVWQYVSPDSDKTTLSLEKSLLF